MAQIPQSFLCPITLQVMEDPVITPDGHSFDRAAITAWIQQHGSCPNTRHPLRVGQLKENRALRDAIQEFVAGMDDNGTTLSQNIELSMEIEQDEHPIDVGIELRGVESQIDGSTVFDIAVRPPIGLQAAPLDIVAVIDVSGSMCSAAKIQSGGEAMDVGFSVLDVTKHALRTVIETLKPSDRISIVSFSDRAQVLCELTATTQSNKSMLMRKVNSLQYGGSTNLWDGMRVGLEQFAAITELSSRVPAMLVLTDGMPSPHMLPNQGIRQTLTKKLASLKQQKVKKLPCICTFGFGYDLDAMLLSDIASIGGGHFSFIPDSGFVGTVIVNSVANISTICGTYAELSLQSENDVQIDEVVGYLSETSGPCHQVSLDTIHLGQEKRFLIRLNGCGLRRSMPDIVCARLQYTNNMGERILVQERLAEEPFSPVEAVTVLQESSTQEERLRLRFVSLLRGILNTAISIESRDKTVQPVQYAKLEESAIAVLEFIAEHKNFDSHPIVQDAEREVSIALTKIEYFNRWGVNYILSLMSAHQQQRCNNFKDASVQRYGSDLFRKERDRADDLFNNMPAPTPSRQAGTDVGNSKARRCSSSSVPTSPKPTTSSKPISMSLFNNVSNGCFHENSMVYMADGTRKQCADVQKGDRVVSSLATGAVSTIKCVVKMDCYNGREEMVTFDSGLCITPWHPVRHPSTSEWVFPADILASTSVPCSAVYNFVLDSKHAVTIDGFECITLGHGIKDSILAHEYFGTDRVIKDLERFPSFEEGWVHFDFGCMQRGFDGVVLGFDPCRIKSESYCIFT